MKNRITKYTTGIIAGFMILGMTIVSCEKYLDKAPAASITEKDVFGNFKSFQGFVEEMYNCVSDYSKTLAGNTYYNFFCADEVLANAPILF